MSDSERKKVVILGGGIAGTLAAKLLEPIADVTLVDPKDHFEIAYAQLRCKVEPNFSDRSLVLHSEYLKKARHIAGFAESASITEVVTSTGDILAYDYLVVATGSVHNGPTTKAERVKEFFSDYEKIKEAKTILIIGGGPVGVELAGEIVVDFPDKKVILAHGGSRLIEFLGPKASEKALGWLRKKNVEVLLNERVDVDNRSEKTYRTSSGQTIEADCDFLCVGRKVSSSWMQSSFLKEVLDETGRVKVDEYLRVEGHTNVFAVGDVTAIKEIKQGFLAGKQVEVLVQNVKLLLKAPDANVKLKEYKPLAKPMGLVSLGRHIAVAELPGVGAIIGWIPGKLKSKDLFVGKTRKGLGLKN